jgi:hypothetical protein
MRPECVVPEYQCAIKRESKRQQKEKNRPNSTTDDLNNNSLSFDEATPTVSRLTSHQEEMIKKLVYFQEEFESPSDEDVRKITVRYWSFFFRICIRLTTSDGLFCLTFDCVSLFLSASRKKTA